MCVEMWFCFIMSRYTVIYLISSFEITLLRSVLEDDTSLFVLGYVILISLGPVCEPNIYLSLSTSYNKGEVCSVKHVKPLQ